MKPLNTIITTGIAMTILISLVIAVLFVHGWNSQEMIFGMIVLQIACFMSGIEVSKAWHESKRILYDKKTIITAT